mgnify:FL=1
MTIKEAINYLHNFNLDNIESRILLKYILKQDDSYIIINSEKDLKENQEKKVINYADKIKNGYPLQYITNSQEFMGLTFYVDDNVLIPQPDTENLVIVAINKIENKNHEEISKTNKEKIKILDLCTGSGAIAVSIKSILKEKVEIIASDISKKAIEVARKNAEKHNVQIKFICSDMFEKINEKFDLIVTNPPYIRSKEIKLLPEEVQKEPHIALDGGLDGLEYYRLIRKNIKKYLKENGTLIMEIGYDQKEDVQKMFKGSKCIKDMENRDRVIIWDPFQVR